MVTIDAWRRDNKDSNKKEGDKKREDRKREDRKREDGRREDRKREESRREERGFQDRKNREERRREREWKQERDEETRRTERYRREHMKDYQRRHYRRIDDDRRFSWDARGDNRCFENNIPLVVAHFDKFRLPRDTRPATFERPGHAVRKTSFKKSWDKRNPDTLLSINRHHDTANEIDADRPRSDYRDKNRANTSRSTIDEDDRDPRRKGKC